MNELDRHCRNRVIVAGGRDFDDYELLCRTLDKLLADMPSYETLIISGHAKGADALGERWAQEHGYDCVLFHADWDGLGKRAGYVRNLQMAQVGTHLVAFYDGISRGTGMMIQIAREHHLIVEVVLYAKPPTPPRKMYGPVSGFAKGE